MEGGCELNGVALQNNLQDPSVKGYILPTAVKVRQFQKGR